MKPDVLKEIRNMIEQEAGREEVITFLQERLTTKEMVEQLATELFDRVARENDWVPIRITQSDFDRHFRIIGFRSDGTPETRGRKTKQA